MNVIIEYFQSMDSDKISLILDNSKKYQGFEKSEYIQKLVVVFDEFKSNGDCNLLALKGHCNGCNTNYSGYRFVGNISGNYINVIFQIKNNTITDIFECGEFKCSSTMKTKMRLFIDKEIYDNPFV